jgi:phosphoribosylformylglycinamidine synthase
MIEHFDSSVEGGSVLMPLGGKYQYTPPEAMAAKIPIISGESETASLMSYGFNPYISSWSPFHGAVFAVIESVSKIVAAGGDYSTIRVTLQEYFGKLKDREKWGRPLASLLGAYYALKELGIPAIGGKDSMSGSFENRDVPPTLIAFSVQLVDVQNVISPEFKKQGSTVILIKLTRNQYEMPNFRQFKKIMAKITAAIKARFILSASTIKGGGIAEVISKMCFGNGIGFIFEKAVDTSSLFVPDYGSFILEIKNGTNIQDIFQEIPFQFLGRTQQKPQISLSSTQITLQEALLAWESPLQDVFPTTTNAVNNDLKSVTSSRQSRKLNRIKTTKPRVLITAFPGTNTEYDTQRAFERVGGKVHIQVFRNLTPGDINGSLNTLEKNIKGSQIIVIPGGFSSGDEPDGSGKFIASVFRNPIITEAVMEFLHTRDGLILGICNGFQALIKLGLVPFGKIIDLTPNSPTLTFNTLGRHVSRMVKTKIVSRLSPWLSLCQLGGIHTIPVSHGEGRFICSLDTMNELIEKGQIATQYVDFAGNPSLDIEFNPNGSMNAVEGITSPDGRVFGKMGHSERIGRYVAQNIPGDKNQELFLSGVHYFS